MTNSRDKGDRGEREVVKLIHDLSGHPAHRLRTPGHQADMGDIGGVPNTVVEVKWWTDPIAAIRQALPQAQRASERSGDDWPTAWVRLHGGKWVVVMEPETFFALHREATS